MKFLLAISILLSVSMLAGCDYLPFGTAEPPDTTSVWATTLAVATAKGENPPVPKRPYLRSNCPTCKGTGKVKSGDGILVIECPDCEPDSASPLSDPSAYVDQIHGVQIPEYILVDKPIYIRYRVRPARLYTQQGWDFVTIPLNQLSEIETQELYNQAYNKHEKISIAFENYVALARVSPSRDKTEIIGLVTPAQAKKLKPSE